MGTVKNLGDENRKEISWQFFIAVFILSQVFNDINQKIKSLCILYLYVKIV